MSKSKGNVIDPLESIDRYGADALRMTLAAMAAQGRDIKLSIQRVEGFRNFATKIWNAARFAEMNELPARRRASTRAAREETLNRWALGECAKAVDEVSAGIQSYKFNEAALAAYRFVWNGFCDWTLELAKPVLQGPDSAAKTRRARRSRSSSTRSASSCTRSCRSSPRNCGPSRARRATPRESVLALAPWPALERARRRWSAEAEIGWVVDLVAEIRSARSETNVPAGAQIPLVLVAPSGGGARPGRALGRHDEAPRAPLGDHHRRRRRRRAPSSSSCAARSRRFRSRASSTSRPSGRASRRSCRSSTRDIAKIDAKLGNADFLGAPRKRSSRSSASGARRPRRARRRSAEALRRLEGAA